MICAQPSILAFFVALNIVVDYILEHAIAWYVCTKYTYIADRHVHYTIRSLKRSVHSYLCDGCTPPSEMFWTEGRIGRITPPAGRGPGIHTYIQTLTNSPSATVVQYIWCAVHLLGTWTKRKKEPKTPSTSHPKPGYRRNSGHPRRLSRFSFACLLVDTTFPSVFKKDTQHATNT